MQAKLFFLFHFGNMAVSYTKAYKDNKKLEYKIAVRQGMFITDYVKTKYDQIYMEAADLYNRINKQYPCKPNLMKTAEFRTWKNKIAAENQQPTHHVPRQRDRYLKPTEYPNITSAEDNTNNNTSPRPINLSTGNRQFVLEIPLINQHSTNITPTNQDDTIETQCVEEGDQQQKEGDQQVARSQEDGGLDENLDTSIFDAVPDHVVGKIISELRSDPSLKQIMEGIENQEIDEQIMDLEIDFPSLEDPLQQEMDNLIW